MNKWSNDEIVKITALLCSPDEESILLGITLIENAKNINPFIPILTFLEVTQSGELQIMSANLCADYGDYNICEEYRTTLEIFHLGWSRDEELYFEKLESYEKYMIEYEAYFNLNPLLSSPYYRIAKQLCRRFKRADLGLIYYEKLLNWQPNLAMAHFDYAFDLDETQNYKKVIKHYTEAKRLGLKDPAVNYNLGKVYAKSKSTYGKAEALFREGLQLYPNFYDTKIELADVVKHRDPEAVYQLFHEVLTIEPHSELALNNLAFLCWCYLKKHEEAKKQILKAIKLNGRKGVYWHTLAEVEWYGFKDAFKALEALNKGKITEPSYTAGRTLEEEIKNQL